MRILVSIILAYLIGSLSFATIIAKLMRTIDPRTAASGNAGATNMLRLAGRKSALYVIMGDALKGFVAVLIARLFYLQGVSLGFIGLIVVLGHVFPLYFNFKGGKGVATLCGALLALSFWTGIFTILAWIVSVFITRYASVGALVAAITAPTLLLITSHWGYFLPTLLTSTLIIWKHLENIQRLKNGTERKVNINFKLK